jgi:hypothetical protein
MRPVTAGGNGRHFVVIGIYFNKLVLIAMDMFVAIDRNPCSERSLIDHYDRVHPKIMA